MKKWSWWIGLTILAIVLGFVQWRYPLPTGTLNVQIAGVVVLAVAVAVDLPLSYGTFILWTISMMLGNVNEWWTAVPVLFALVAVSLVLKWHSRLDLHFTHTQAINFGLIAGACQLVGMLVIVAVQAMLATGQWDDFVTILRVSVPAALLGGLLVCLLLPPATLLVRHFTEEPQEPDSNKNE
ncbi:hypothetical protein [Limosilactobacillus caecicola]|uniref:hypothetical protein n=1 Tax=Limosilactobacillus caecicola TaxID=2941332 RepID=UPI00203FB779|nr:hypothetical protein [Limosilactobacillus caecicola]